MADKREHHGGQAWILREAGIPTGRGHCVAVSFARAMAWLDNRLAWFQRGTIEWVPTVVDLLVEHPGIPYIDGEAFGTVGELARMIGIPGDLLRSQEELARTGSDRRGRYQDRARYPTAAQWCRRHLEVRAAILRGTGHAGFMARDPAGVAHVFDMGARKRIDHAYVLDYVQEGEA